MADQTIGVILEGRDAASGAIKEVGAALEETRGSAEHASSAFERIKDSFESGMGFAAGITGFRELTDVLEDLGNATVHFNATLEVSALRLENLTGSAQETQEALQRLRELSDDSPFKFTELEGANERLLRFNFSIDESSKLLKVAADAAAGGYGTVDGITQAFGRLNEKTDLSTRGLMQLMMTGLPVYKILAEGLGVTAAEAEKLVSKGLIPTAQGIDILQAGMEKLNKDMASRTASTFDSVKKTIADSMDFIFAELGKPVFDVLENAAKEWLAWLQSPPVKEAVTAFAGGLKDALQAAGDAFEALKGPVGTFANDVKTIAGGALQFIADRLNDVGDFLSGWAAQAGAAGTVVDRSLTGTSEVVQALQFLLQGNFAAAWQDARKAVDDFRQAIVPIVQFLQDNQELIKNIAIAFGTFIVIETVVAPLVAAAAGMIAFAEGIAAWVAVMGPVEGILAATVAALGGPVTLAIVGVSVAVGVMATAWITDFGGIQEKTAAFVGFIQDHSTQIETAIYAAIPLFGELGIAWVNDFGGIQEKTAAFVDTLGGLFGNVASAIGTTMENVAINVENKAARWGPAIGAAWDQIKTDTSAKLTDFENMVTTTANNILNTLEDWRDKIQKGLTDAFSSTGPLSELGKLGALIVNALKPITDKIQWLLDTVGQLKGLVGDAASATGTWLNAGDSGPAAQSRPSQFNDPQLSAEEAKAACGPAALVAFMRVNGGRVPTLREAVDLAKSTPGVGWDTEVGMETGITGEQALLSTKGLSSTLTMNPATMAIESGANSGAGEIIDTLHHFFVASGFDASTGKYNVGTSGSDLIGGSDQMTMAEMTNLMGPVIGILTDIKSTNAQTADATSKTADASTGGPLSTYEGAARQAAAAHNIDPNIFWSQIQEEGGIDAQGKPRTSPAGAVGIAQFMPTTARARGLKDPTDPIASLDAAAALDAEMLTKYGGDWKKTLAGYNAGEGAVDKAGGVPQFAETQKYVAEILNRANQAGGGGAGLRDNSRGAPGNQSQQLGDMPTGPVDNTAAIAALSAPEVDKLDVLTRETDKALSNIQTKEDTGLDAAAAQYGSEGKDVAAAEADAAKKTAQIDWNRDPTQIGSAANTKARKDALAEEIKDDTLKNTQNVAAAELINTRRLQDQATAHSRGLEDAQIATNQQLAAQAVIHQRGLEDRAIEHSHALEDAKIVADQKLAHEALVHQRTLQDAEIQYQDGVQKEAVRHQQQLQNEDLEHQHELAHAATLHQRQLEDQSIPVADTLSDAATAHQRQLQDAEAAYQLNRNISKNPGNATALNAAAADAAEQLAHQRQLQDAEEKYQEDLAARALVTRRALEDTEVKYQQDLAATALARQRDDAKTESDYQMGLKDTELRHQRGLQDTEVEYQKGIAAAALDTARKNAATELEYQRGLQDAAVEYANRLAATALARKRVEEDAERVYQRGVEDAAIQHKLDLEAAARAFEKQEKGKQDVLDNQLADEAADRQKKLIADELAAKKASIADEFLAKVTAIIATAAAERTTLKETADQKAQDIIAAATKALAGFNGQGDPIIQDMKDKLAAMDAAFSTATTDVQGNAVKQQAAQDATAAHAASAATTINTAVGSTDAAYALSAADISRSLGITDAAVEASATATGKNWDDTRDDLNTAVAAYGVGSKEISDAFGITDRAVEQYALDQHADWEKARVDLNAAALHAGEVLGTDGTIPQAAKITTTAFDDVEKAAAKTSALDQMKQAAQDLADAGFDPASKAARDLQTAIDDLKDKTITITTKFEGGSGQPTGQGGSIGASGASIAGGGYTIRGAGPGTVDANSESGIPAGGGLTGMGGGTGGDSSPASPFSASTIGSSGPGGRYNNPQTGQPYTHAAGGVTTGPVGGIFGESGPEAIIPLGEYMLSHKATSGSEMTDTQLRKLAIMFAEEVASRIPTTIGVDQVHSALLQKSRRGPLGLK